MAQTHHDGFGPWSISQIVQGDPFPLFDDISVFELGDERQGLDEF